MSDLVASFSEEEEENRKILDLVVDRRRVLFKDLQEDLHLDREKARRALKSLKEAHLIAERGAPFEDFSVYYVTAEGLEAAHELRRRGRPNRGLLALG